MLSALVPATILRENQGREPLFALFRRAVVDNLDSLSLASCPIPALCLTLYRLPSARAFGPSFGLGFGPLR